MNPGSFRARAALVLAVTLAASSAGAQTRFTAGRPKKAGTLKLTLVAHDRCTKVVEVEIKEADVDMDPDRKATRIFEQVFATNDREGRWAARRDHDTLTFEHRHEDTNAWRDIHRIRDVVDDTNEPDTLSTECRCGGVFAFGFDEAAPARGYDVEGRPAVVAIRTRAGEARVEPREGEPASAVTQALLAALQAAGVDAVPTSATSLMIISLVPNAFLAYESTDVGLVASGAGGTTSSAPGRHRLRPCASPSRRPGQYTQSSS